MKGGTETDQLLFRVFATGNYIFRAYTSWMKNFSPDFYFEQTIHIVNTLKKSPVVPASKLGPYSVFSGRRK